MARGWYLPTDAVHVTAMSAVEIACWDLLGKSLGVPLHRLLGGAARDQVPVYANGWYRGRRTPEDFAARAREVARAGIPRAQVRSVRRPPTATLDVAGGGAVPRDRRGRARGRRPRRRADDRGSRPVRRAHGDSRRACARALPDRVVRGAGPLDRPRGAGPRGPCRARARRGGGAAQPARRLRAARPEPDGPDLAARDALDRRRVRDPAGLGDRRRVRRDGRAPQRARARSAPPSTPTSPRGCRTSASRSTSSRARCRWPSRFSAARRARSTAC